jgi:hypothetical protein
VYPLAIGGESLEHAKQYGFRSVAPHLEKSESIAISWASSDAEASAIETESGRCLAD